LTGTETTRSSKTMAKPTGAMVYGIVMYDFAAERPDELDAKAGEAIIVIAQSNPEWFVAKPIGRLGGPGLIPVSFIEIRDMSSGQAVPDAYEAVQRAGVPKVEEWKKMAADYKNSSITLGKFEVPSSQQQQQLQQQQQQLEQGMDRMSLQQGRQSQSNGYVSAEFPLDPFRH
jgi:bud emergence protein 1